MKGRKSLLGITLTLLYPCRLWYSSQKSKETTGTIYKETSVAIPVTRLPLTDVRLFAVRLERNI
jgi:hypothetical protein